MRALLLAAGAGTRLAPLTDILPKCLMPIRGVPLLQIWLCQLKLAGVGPLLINTHHHAEAVTGFLAGSAYSAYSHTVEEQELLNTGGSLLANRDFFGRETMMLIHADNLSLCDYRAFVTAHEKRPQGCLMTMMTFTTDSPRSCGIVEVDSRGVVVGFHEKQENPPGDLANGAVYILEPEVVDFMASLGHSKIDFSLEVLPHFLGRTATFHNDRYHRDIGTPESLCLAQTEAPSSPCLHAGNAVRTWAD